MKKKMDGRGIWDSFPPPVVKVVPTSGKSKLLFGFLITLTCLSFQLCTNILTQNYSKHIGGWGFKIYYPKIRKSSLIFCLLILFTCFSFQLGTNITKSIISNRY
jgi:hypothetical protein